MSIKGFVYCLWILCFLAMVAKGEIEKDVILHGYHSVQGNYTEMLEIKGTLFAVTVKQRYWYEFSTLVIYSTFPMAAILYLWQKKVGKVN